MFANPLPSLLARQPVFNLIVLLGIIPWLAGHTVAGMFALQVRRMSLAVGLCCWEDSAFGISLGTLSVYKERGNKNLSSSDTCCMGLAGK